MAKIVGVRFKDAGRIYYFDPIHKNLKKGDKVIVETTRGMECAEIALEPRDIPDDQVVKPIKPIIRTATEKDIKSIEENAEKEKEAFGICLDKINKHGLEMKLTGVEYTFDGSKIVFYFTADGRVDFRELVKDLAGEFRKRIELRQIGVRDQAKMLGGLGICGQQFCCSRFLSDFQPVSIKMAKEQGLALNPTKISGTCGRLMCCLKYEQDTYEALLKEVPSQGDIVKTPEGRGIVVDSNILSGKLKVKLDKSPELAPTPYIAKQVKIERRAKTDNKKEDIPDILE